MSKLHALQSTSMKPFSFVPNLLKASFTFFSSVHLVDSRDATFCSSQHITPTSSAARCQSTNLLSFKHAPAHELRINATPRHRQTVLTETSVFLSHKSKTQSCLHHRAAEQRPLRAARTHARTRSRDDARASAQHKVARSPGSPLSLILCKSNRV